MVKSAKFSYIIPVLRSLHWLKINKRVEYKLLSLTYKVLTTSQPDYLQNLISVQSPGNLLLIYSHVPRLTLLTLQFNYLKSETITLPSMM